MQSGWRTQSGTSDSGIYEMAGNSETVFRTTANRAISLRAVVGRRSSVVGPHPTNDVRLMTFATATSRALVPVSLRAMPSARRRLRLGFRGPAIRQLLPAWPRTLLAFRLRARLRPFAAPDLALRAAGQFSWWQYADRPAGEGHRQPARVRASPRRQRSDALQAYLPMHRPWLRVLSDCNCSNR